MASDSQSDVPTFDFSENGVTLRKLTRGLVDFRFPDSGLSVLSKFLKHTSDTCT